MGGWERMGEEFFDFGQEVTERMDGSEGMPSGRKAPRRAGASRKALSTTRRGICRSHS